MKFSIRTINTGETAEGDTKVDLWALHKHVHTHVHTHTQLKKGEKCPGPCSTVMRVLEAVRKETASRALLRCQAGKSV